MSLFRSIINTFLFHAGSLLGLIIRCDYVAKARNGKRVSEKTLLRILKANRNTEYGKKRYLQSYPQRSFRFHRPDSEIRDTVSRYQGSRPTPSDAPASG